MLLFTETYNEHKHTHAIVDADTKKHRHAQNKWPKGGPSFSLDTVLCVPRWPI